MASTNPISATLTTTQTCSRCDCLSTRPLDCAVKAIVVQNGFLFAGSVAGVVNMWKKDDLSYLGARQAHAAGLSALLSLPNSSHIVTAHGREMRFWKYEDAGDMPTLEPDTGCPTDQDISSVENVDERTLAVNFVEKIGLLDIERATYNTWCSPKEGAVDSTCYRAPHLLTFCSSEDHASHAHFWDLRTPPDERALPSLFLHQKLTAMTACGDNQVAFGVRLGKILLFDTRKFTNVFLEQPQATSVVALNAPSSSTTLMAAYARNEGSAVVAWDCSSDKQEASGKQKASALYTTPVSTIGYSESQPFFGLVNGRVVKDQHFLRC